MNEDKILTKCAVILLSQTGLRLSEILSLKIGCVKPLSEGGYYMDCTISKTNRGIPTPHKIFVNELVVDTIQELEEHTNKLRQESEFEELFLSRVHGHYGEIVTLKPSSSWYTRIKKFIKKWDIRGDDGELYPLQAHQFRVNYCNDLIRKRVPISFIMKHYQHVTSEMTDHYKRVKIEETANMVKSIIAPNSKIAGINASIIKRNLAQQFKGKAEEEIEDFISNLTKEMYINPLPTGICLQDSRRGGCDNGDGCIFINCPNYVTTEEYYPIHKRELDLLESEMERYEAEGRTREHQRLKAKWIYLNPIVERLEAQIHGNKEE
ncbi:tyrosine-type recombinase/integrase [Bacillaceae bacterium IKA-2]|nr:tyrosine-type recombinase/integrase [Bacillaceae bacterium IKA-2]